MGSMEGRRDPVGAALLHPARSGGGPDAQRAELVERKDAVGEVLQDVLDAVELDVALGSVDLLPRLGALEGNPAASQQ
ncbi:hypothetical protein [Streptomyces noursei]|uniref:hypothetical protein n=1 Tax=Streptomyces noursei TaxID=1971 RepID=UPI003EB701A4